MEKVPRKEPGWLTLFQFGLDDGAYAGDDNFIVMVIIRVATIRLGEINTRRVSSSAWI